MMWTLLSPAAAVLWMLACWKVASGVAHRRGIALGPVPGLWIGASGVGGLWLSNNGPSSLPSIVAAAGSVVCAVVDFRCGSIFNRLVAFAAGGTLAAAALAGDLPRAAEGAAASALALAAIRLASRGRGLGLGDVKLGIVIGAAGGITGGVSAVGSAFVLGAVRAMWGIVRGTTHLGEQLAFGPYLAAGTWLILAYERINGGLVP